MGRPPLGNVAMTGLERLRRHRAKLRASEPKTKSDRPALPPETKLPPAADTRVDLVGTDIGAPSLAKEEVTQKVSGAGEPPETLPSAPNDPWALSATDLTRHAGRFRAARKEKGELIATRALKWQLQDTGTPYQFLQREVDRIRHLAEH